VERKGGEGSGEGGKGRGEGKGREGQGKEDRGREREKTTPPMWAGYGPATVATYMWPIIGWIDLYLC